MFALFAFPCIHSLPRITRLPRATALRGLACGLALAAGLSTLAGSGAADRQADLAIQPSLLGLYMGFAAGAVTVTSPGATSGATPSAAATSASIAAQSAPYSSADTSAAKKIVMGTDRSREPPPYAPGGDDILNVGEAAPQLARLVSIEPATAGEPGLGARSAAATNAVSNPTGGIPSLMLWLDRTRVALGERVVLHVAAIGAGECKGAGELQGVPDVGTRVVVRPTAPGPHRLAVSCAGEGGHVERAVTLIVPLPVLATSLENQQQIDFDPARLPSVRQLGNSTLEVIETDSSEDLQAPGDFFQEGRSAVFVTGGGTSGAATGATDTTASAYFLARDESGRWVDRTAELLPNPGDRRTCSGPGQAITADFNLDGKPDVYVACQGVPALPGEAPGGCCRQVLFLSQHDGRYRRVETAFSIQARQAEAGDVDGDGLIDIVTIDTTASAARPLLLLGRGDGTFLLGGAHLLPAWVRQAASAPLQGRR